jgi:predicted amidohydrolase
MRVTAVQLKIEDRTKDGALAHVLAELDAARGSDLVLLPELWPCGYFSFARYATDAEPLDGPLIKAMCAKARDLGSYLFLGSFVERDGDKLYNTSALIDSSGKLAARYRKMHLFGYESQEPKLLAPGTDVVVASTPWGVAGLSICYDIRFPELYRAMIAAGAEFFLVAAAWPAARVESWTLLNRARALENLAYVFACNGCGTSGNVELAGHSLVIDPRGRVLAEGGAGPSFVTADVDPMAVRRLRTEFPALSDRVL